MTISIEPIPALTDNYIWAISNRQHSNAVIVDPGEASPVITYLETHGCALAGILITHHHWDHTNGVTELKNRFDVPVFGSAQENIANMTHPVQDGDIITIPNFPLTLRVIAIPGHTLGHIAYYAPGMLFCGDTLFSAGCGRVFEGTMSQMYATLQKIAALPAATKIYCGHEYTLKNLHFAKLVEPGNKFIAAKLHIVEEKMRKHSPSLPSLLSDEKQVNPFLRCGVKEIIARVEAKIGKKIKNQIDVFTELRKWKDAY